MRDARIDSRVHDGWRARAQVVAGGEGNASETGKDRGFAGGLGTDHDDSGRVDVAEVDFLTYALDELQLLAVFVGIGGVELVVGRHAWVAE